MIEPSRSGRGGCRLLCLVDLIQDGVEVVRAFDGVLPPESLSFAGGRLRFPGPWHARTPRNPSIISLPMEAGFSCSRWRIFFMAALKPPWRWKGFPIATTPASMSFHLPFNQLRDLVAKGELCPHRRVIAPPLSAPLVVVAAVHDLEVP